MLDRFIAGYGAVRHSAIDLDYRPSQAITSKRLSNPRGNRLSVLFPPWHGGGVAYDILTRRLARNGSAVLSYNFHGQILQPDIDSVVESFNVIQDSVVADIHALSEKHDYCAVNLIASSLGNVSLAMVADKHASFQKATLVVAGSNLARCMWDGGRTRSIRQQFETQNISVSVLDDAWRQLAPKAHVDAFKDKEVLMYLSESDTIIPARYQREIAENLQAVTDNIHIHTDQSGHAATIAGFCLRGEL